MNSYEKITYCQECQKFISQNLVAKAKINKVRQLIVKYSFEEIILEALNILLDIEKVRQLTVKYSSEEIILEALNILLDIEKRNLEKIVSNRNLHLVRTNT